MGAKFFKQKTNYYLILCKWYLKSYNIGFSKETIYFYSIYKSYILFACNN